MFPRSESFQAIEADINHANTLADAIREEYGGASIKMRLSFSSFGHVLLFLMQLMNCSCICSTPNYLGLFHVIINKVSIDGKKKMISYERRATLQEFYGVIYPTLEQLESEIVHNDKKDKGKGQLGEADRRIGSGEWWKKVSDTDSDRDHECGICLEVGTKMVLPNCNHALCSNCYRDWNMKSQSCPFCRDSLKRIASSDLWVLMNEGDVVDADLVLQENLKRFNVYIDKLPLAIPDSVFVTYYEFLV